MFQPHSIVYDGRRVLIMRHEKTDYYHGTPLGERLNLLRYSVTFWPRTPKLVTINSGGWLARQWSNLNWHLWRRRWTLWWSP